MKVASVVMSMGQQQKQVQGSDRGCGELTSPWCVVARQLVTHIDAPADTQHARQLDRQALCRQHTPVGCQHSKGEAWAARTWAAGCGRVAYIRFSLLQKCNHDGLGVNGPRVHTFPGKTR